MHHARSLRLVLLVAAFLSCGRSGPTPPGDGARGDATPAPSTGQGLLVSSPGSLVEEEYAYDRAGELVSVRTSGPAAALAVSDFEPKTGAAGRVVSVTGTGFRPEPAGNVVRLNGTQAVVLSSTATRLSFAVPAGATTGRIGVSVGSETATSAADFVVRPPVVVSDFAPRMGKAGTVLTITGSGFDPDPTRNTVSMGGASLAVASGSSTSLVATVSAGASSGKITVATSDSSATSTAEFIVLPGALVEGDVAFSAAMDRDAPTAVPIPTAGKAGVLLFGGVEGRSCSLHVSGVTYAGTTRLTIYEPLGASIFTTTIGAGQERKYALAPLPRSGAYTVVVQPAVTSTGTASIRVFEDVVVPLDPRGAPAAMTLARGQNGRFVFTGRPADRLDLGISSLAGTAALAVVQPDGAAIGTRSVSTPVNWQLPLIEMPGLHALTVSPLDTAQASLTVTVSVPLAGKFPLADPKVRFESARTGQTGRYTFVAAAGDRYTLMAVAGTGFTSNVSVTVYRPSGASVASASVAAGRSTKIDPGRLPETGSYTVLVAPQGTGSGSLDLALVPEATDALVVGGPAKTVSLTAAQNGRYTFAGDAGEYISIGYPTVSIVPSGSTLSLAVSSADGTTLATKSATAAGSWQLPPLPSAGTYELTVVPSGPSAVDLTFLLSRPITGALARDGAATRFESARAGQAGRYTFAAAAGESDTVTATASTGFSGNVAVTVLRPNGASVGSAGAAPGGRAKIDLSVLPESGTYTVVVVPPGVSTGSVDLMLLSQAADTLVIGGPSKALTLVSGQNGRYAFAATQGDLLLLSYPSFATTPSGRTAGWYVYGPDGSTLASKSVNAAGTWSLPQIPASGIYTLAVKPPDTVAASFSLQLTRR